MEPFYLGVDVSKGYADFMILDSEKQPAVKGFQLDDTFDGHQSLYGMLDCFTAEHPIRSCLPEWRVPVDMKTTGTNR
jgi:hypothetical protein